MATLQIRDLPDYIYNRLKEDAQKERRSLSQQTAFILGKGLALELNNKQKRSRVLDSLKSFSSEIDALNLSDPIMMVRKDRER